MSKHRPRIPVNKRQRVYDRDRNQCQYCGVYPLHPTIDHLIPISLGGKSNIANLLTCCFKCNHKKGNDVSVKPLSKEVLTGLPIIIDRRSQVASQSKWKPRRESGYYSSYKLIYN